MMIFDACGMGILPVLELWELWELWDGHPARPRTMGTMGTMGTMAGETPAPQYNKVYLKISFRFCNQNVTAK